MIFLVIDIRQNIISDNLQFIMLSDIFNSANCLLINDLLIFDFLINV